MSSSAYGNQKRSLGTRYMSQTIQNVVIYFLKDLRIPLSFVIYWILRIDYYGIIICVSIFRPTSVNPPVVMDD